MRLGLDMVRPLASGSINLLGLLKGAWRAEHQGSHSSGEIIALGRFDLNGQGYRRSWARVGVGAETKVAGGTASLKPNGTTQGDPPGLLAGSFLSGQLSV